MLTGPGPGNELGQLLSFGLLQADHMLGPRVWRVQGAEVICWSPRCTQPCSWGAVTYGAKPGGPSTPAPVWSCS